MLLPGRLSRSTLGDVLGALYRTRASGALILSEDAPSGVRQHTIHLSEGLVSHVETSLPYPTLGACLSALGATDARDIERSLASRAFHDQRKAGELLVDRGLSSPDAIQRALAYQLRAKMDVLFSVTDARLSFRPPRAPAHEEHVPPPLGLGDYLFGRPRRCARRTPPETWAGVRAERARREAYRLLELPMDAPESAVRRAFRRRALALHPDRASALEGPARSRELARVSAAYHLLTDRVASNPSPANRPPRAPA